ncbi:MAG: Hsp20/alpha crystallin family protein [Glaciihabitans sp.]
MATSFDPFSGLDRLAEDLLQARVSGPRAMLVDLYREGDQYVLNADLPGIDPGSIDVDVDGQLLTIRAERTADRRNDVKWLTSERPAGSFLRQFSLGQGVDPARIEANYNNGVLSVIIPVSEKAKPRKIQIATSPGIQGATGSSDSNSS